MWTNSLKLKVWLTMRESFTGSRHQEQKISRAGTEGKSYFPCDRTGKYPLCGLKTNWFPLVSSSWECHLLLRSSLHSGTPDGTRHREVLREKTILLICFINLICVTPSGLTVQHVMQRGLMLMGWGLGSICGREMEININSSNQSHSATCASLDESRCGS